MELKVGDIVEHVHPGCPNNGGVGVVAYTEPGGENKEYLWYHVCWIIEPQSGFWPQITRFVKDELTLRSEP